jgi:hypothetical protein
VFDQLHSSLFPEHKVHFGPFLLKAGNPLLARVAALNGVSEAAIGKSVDSLVDLEFYMPVKGHWATWAGGPDLIVATALKDHEIPIAYDLEGSLVPLSSSVTPPATPTLAIVPVETDFTVPPQRAQCYEDCGGGDPPPPPAGVLMTFSYIPGDYEGFLMGDPEFEVHALARKNSTDTQVTDWQCAGEHASSATDQPGIKSTIYNYDQNGDAWTGIVLLASKIQVEAAQTFDSSLIYTVWEDDNTACRIIKDHNDVFGQISAVSFYVGQGLNAIAAYLANNISPLLLAARLVRDVKDLITALQNDDFVGIMVEASKAGVSYSDANYAIVQAANGQLQIRGRVMLVPQP